MSREPSPADDPDLYSASAVRERASRMLEIGLEGELDHFGVRLEWLDRAAERVARVTRRSYPSLEIPYHGRLGHFAAGGHDRIGASAVGADSKSLVDCIVVSVLLDAGAGPAWRYREKETGLELGRSEGLAVASFRMFEAERFSGEAEALRRITPESLGAGFQVSESNPLVGLDGRCGLLHGLAAAVDRSPQMFGRPGRVGKFIDYVTAESPSGRVPAPRILEWLLEGLGGIWPGHGDVFFHRRVGWVPFHKLAQWLTYSLIEPLEREGLTVTELDGLTGLAEYRNGGLFVDTGVLEPKHDGVLRDEHEPSDEVVVEWRALTVALLDRIAPRVREALSMSADALPLAKILEGGTWRAGREIASELREDGSPPLKVRSAGNLF